MPTGYTYEIEEGKITTGKEFLLQCSRAFGVALCVRDEPLSVPTPEYIEPSTTYKEWGEQMQKELERARKLSLDEYRKECIALHEKSVIKAKEQYKKYSDILARCNKIRYEVVMWKPPTPEHKPIKDFALEQIDMCIDDVRKMQANCQEEIDRIYDISDESIMKELNAHISHAEQYAQYCMDSYQEEVKRISERNEYMKQFIVSLQ